MVLIRGGVSTIGTDNPLIAGDGEGPKQSVYLTSFYLDKYEVSNDGMKLILSYLKLSLYFLT